MGVKDTFYGINRPSFDFAALIQSLSGEMVPCDYELAHNLIYGAVDFALEFGIPSHSDWKLTQYMLEEDTEDIPLMDLEFGINGRPVFTSLQEDISEEEYLDEDMIWEAHRLVLSNIDLAYKKAFPATDPAFGRQVKDAHDKLKIAEEAVNETDEEEAYMLEDTHEELMELMEAGDKSAIRRYQKKISEKIQQYPNQPILLNYLSNSYFAMGNEAEGLRIAERCLKDFPDYLLGRILYAFFLVLKKEFAKVWDIIGGQFEIQKLMPGRKTFHPQEVYSFYAVLILYLLGNKGDIEKTLPYSDLILAWEDDPFRWAAVEKAMDAVTRAKVNALEKKYDKGLEEIMKELEIHGPLG